MGLIASIITGDFKDHTPEFPAGSECFYEKTPFTTEEKCKPIFPVNHKPAARQQTYTATGHKTDPKNGVTTVRVTMGMHESMTMAGSSPAIALWNEFGQRVGDAQPSPEGTIEGGFRDIEILHTAMTANVRSSYILIRGGIKPMCIASIAISHTDGTKQLFTGDDIDRCGILKTSPSRTFVGPSYRQPKCFWLHGSESPGNDHRYLYAHLPDFIWTRTRKVNYLENRDLACKATPRLFAGNTSFHGNVNALTVSMPFFNPPIHYNEKTQFDQPADYNLRWHMRTNKKESWQEWTDRPFTLNSPLIKPRSKRSDNNSEQLSLAQMVDLVNMPTNKSMPMLPVNPVEPRRVRTEPPKLVVSAGAISAQQVCKFGQWNHTDYISLAERIYCDMQNRNMFWLCDEVRKENCWSMDAMKLQGSGRLAPAVPFNSTRDRYAWNGSLPEINTVLPDFSGSWAAQGPMFGYAYQNITIIG